MQIFMLLWCWRIVCVSIARLHYVRSALNGHRKRIAYFYGKLWRLGLLHCTLTPRSTTRLCSWVWHLNFLLLSF